MLMPNLHFLLSYPLILLIPLMNHTIGARQEVLILTGHYDTGTWYSSLCINWCSNKDPLRGQSRTGQATPPPLNPTTVLPTLVGKSDEVQTSPLSDHKSRRH